MSKTSSGTLHADDQPLEPLIAPSGSRLILPSDFSYGSDYQKQGLLDICLLNRRNNDLTLVGDWRSTTNSVKHSVAAVFRCEPQTHGVIKKQPETLLDLHELCIAAGLNLGVELAKKIQLWHLEKPSPQILGSDLILILLLPKKRNAEEVETTEIVAFITGKSVEIVGQQLDVIQKHGGKAGYVLGEIQVKPESLRQVPVGLLQVHKKLDAKSAAAMNGVASFDKKVFGIGAGALGSQIFNNLVRAGFGTWTVIDPDVLLPHNCARHFLGDWAVGSNKAEAVAQVANAMLDGPPIAVAIPGDFLKPGEAAAEMESRIKDATVVMDFSASVAVARRLAEWEIVPRCIVAYLAPSGTALAIGVEDEKRVIRLDWLEMLHYRAVLNVEGLKRTFISADSHLRYGNSCRDVSTALSQDEVAIWAGIASKEIKRLVLDAKSCLKIFVSREDGTVEVENVDITKIISVKIGDWTVRFDDWLLEKVSSFRKARLPNETGGVLLGHFDTHSRICSIIDLLPSPPDSEEWPTSYIRGCQGLLQKVAEVERNTLGQITYVGEWHSHPDRCSVMPSQDDMAAYSWLESKMRVEDLPALMMIVGDKRKFNIVIRT